MGKKNNPKKQPRVYLYKVLKKFQHNGEISKNKHKEISVSDNTCVDRIIPSNKAQIYESELKFIAKCIADYPNIETGGELYGSWTASGAPRIIYAIGPGPKANHQQTFFNQDITYLNSIGSKLKEYGLQHIGEWHSHHKLGLAKPSGHDAQTMYNGLIQKNLTRLILCIGNIKSSNIISINPFNFAKGSNYVECSWEIIHTQNRIRETIDTQLYEYLIQPSTTDFKLNPNYQIIQTNNFNEDIGWFSIKENRQQLKKIIDKLNEQEWIHSVKPRIGDNKQIQLEVVARTFKETIHFPSDYPSSPFEVIHTSFINEDVKRFKCGRCEPNFEFSISEIFWNNYKSLILSING